MAGWVDRFRTWFLGAGPAMGGGAPFADLAYPYGGMRIAPEAIYLWGSPYDYPGAGYPYGVAQLLGRPNPDRMADISAMSPATMWQTQPHLRTVVAFLARNLAQLGLHVFVRTPDEGRLRDRDSLLARVLAAPNSYTTTYELIYALMGDMALYDRAYWRVGADSDSATGWAIHRIPPTWVEPIAGSVFRNAEYVVRPRSGEEVKLTSAEVIDFTGYHPGDPRSGSPTVDALKDVLQEQIESLRARQQRWKNGGRVSAVIEAEKGSLQGVSPEQLDRFREDWRSQYTGNGPNAGGTPILPDGMTLKSISETSRDSQWAEGVKLALATVAAAYHVNPIMVGILENATLANVREFRKMLYGETLGPQVRQIEARLTQFLVPMLGGSPETYIEFNVAEKLRGDFEEASSSLQTATGAPWMTRNEARARQNLPKVDGGDELVTPLNVLIGGQASPTDSAPPPKSSAAKVAGESVDAFRGVLEHPEGDIAGRAQNASDYTGPVMVVDDQLVEAAAGGTSIRR